jgi:hypothetical protein
MSSAIIVERPMLESPIDDSISGIFQPRTKRLRRSAGEGLRHEAAKTGMTWRLQVDEGLPDVSRPGGPLRRVNAPVEILIDLFGVETVTEVAPESLTILQHG